MAALGACLGLLSAPAAGAVDRARPARHDAARLGAAQSYSPSPGPVHGVRANRSIADAGVFARVGFHLGYAHALRRPTAARYRSAIPAQSGPQSPDGNECCSQVSALWVPRVLGLLTFVAVLIAIWRSSINVPELNDPANTAAVYKALVEVATLVVAGAVVFFGYTLWRPRRAEIPILHLLKSVNRVLAPLWRKISPGLEADRGSDEEISRDVGRLLLVGWLLLQAPRM